MTFGFTLDLNPNLLGGLSPYTDTLSKDNMSIFLLKMGWFVHKSVSPSWFGVLS